MSDPVVMARLAALEARMAAVESGGAPRANGPAAASTSSGGGVASDYEMSGEKGDPTLKKHPPRWTGPAGEFVGKRFSQCSAEILTEVAGFLDWKADKEAAEGKDKYAGYSRLDARRARGWAAKIRGGYVAPPEAPSAFAGGGGAAGDGFGAAGTGFGTGNDSFDYGSAPSDDSDIPF